MEGRRNRKAVTLRSIIQDDRKANREELELLFLNYVSPNMPEFKLKWMRRKELVRMVVISIYYHNVVRNQRDHKSIVNLLRLSMPVSRANIYTFIKPFKQKDDSEDEAVSQMQINTLHE